MDNDKFEMYVQEAYDILWKMHYDGDVDTEQDAKLIKMTNAIDDQLER